MADGDNGEKTGEHGAGKLMTKIRDELEKNFKMTYIGEPKKYLGISIERNRKLRRIFIHQRQFIEEMTEKYQFGKEQKASQ